MIIDFDDENTIIETFNEKIEYRRFVNNLIHAKEIENKDMLFNEQSEADMLISDIIEEASELHDLLNSPFLEQYLPVTVLETIKTIIEDLEELKTMV